MRTTLRPKAAVKAENQKIIVEGIDLEAVYVLSDEFKDTEAYVKYLTLSEAVQAIIAFFQQNQCTDIHYHFESLSFIDQ